MKQYCRLVLPALREVREHEQASKAAETEEKRMIRTERERERGRTVYSIYYTLRSGLWISVQIAAYFTDAVKTIYYLCVVFVDNYVESFTLEVLLYLCYLTVERRDAVGGLYLERHDND